MLRFENVHVYYGQVHALKGITGEVHEGELVAILGANGAGKSTTLMSVSGILKTRTGKIIYEDKRSDPGKPIRYCATGRDSMPRRKTHLWRLDGPGKFAYGRRTTTGSQ